MDNYDIAWFALETNRDHSVVFEIASKYYISDSFVDHDGLECKSRKPRNTWITGNFDLGGQHEAGQRLIEFCQENALLIANTFFQQHKRRLNIWTSPDGQPKNQIIFFASKGGETLYSQQNQDGELILAHTLHIAKFRLKLKKVEKTTRPFRYDLIRSLMIIQWK